LSSYLSDGFNGLSIQPRATGDSSGWKASQLAQRYSTSPLAELAVVALPQIGQALCVEYRSGIAWPTAMSQQARSLGLKLKAPH
jgi:hypothetical protein